MKRIKNGLHHKESRGLKSTSFFENPIAKTCLSFYSNGDIGYECIKAEVEEQTRSLEEKIEWLL